MKQNQLNLTKQEQQWLKKFVELMNAAPPSLADKASLFTIGDNYLGLYPKAVDKINEEADEDLGRTLGRLGAEVVRIPMPMQVHSVAE